MNQNSLLLDAAWYFALPSSAISSGKTQKKTICDIDVLIGRDASGEAFAVKDQCPHRGMPFSHGWFDGQHLKCSYHGWEFNTQGICQKAPALTEHDEVTLDRICVEKYPVKEVDEKIWVFISRRSKENPPTEFPYAYTTKFPLVKHLHLASVELPVSMDVANFGLLDPAHVPYVHKSWFWRSGTSRKMKTKHFDATHLGFMMKAHKPSSNSKPMKMFGDNATTQITFQIPGSRTELIETDELSVVSFTTHTPIDENRTEFNHFIHFSDSSKLLPIYWLAKLLGKSFLMQDYHNFVKLSDGLHHGPKELALGEVDRQYKWYLKLKEMYKNADDKNQVQGVIDREILRWYT